MPAKILTYVDANVLIYAAGGDTLERKLRALKVLSDKRREFLASEFLRLETLPFALRSNRAKERAFLEWYFERHVNLWIEDERKLFEPAARLIEKYPLQLLDALHLAAAISLKAEFVTAEKPTKPFHAAYPRVATLYSK
jgi:predicted nucleic acid-binding protein